MFIGLDDALRRGGVENKDMRLTAPVKADCFVENAAS